VTVPGSAKYLFLAVTTDGADPIDHVILEVAWIVTDRYLHERERQTWLAPSCYLGAAQPAEEAQARGCDADLIERHATSGLWSELGQATPARSQYRDALVSTIEGYDWGVAPILAGWCVHRDRAFIRWWVPRVEERLSDLHLDLASVNLALGDCAGASAPALDLHARAMPRALASLERARDVYQALSIHASGGGA